MAAFLLSLVVTALMVGVIVQVGKRRAPGTYLTWGEAFGAGLYSFVLMFLVYGIVPHQFLAWADNELGWRSDSVGIPLGPLGGIVRAITPNAWEADNLLAPNGIALPNGSFIITAQVVRDVLVSGIYIVFLVAQILLWLWWQKRGKQSAAPELESSYGRPLVRGT